MFAQTFTGDDAGLGKAIHAFLDLDHDVSICG